MAQVIVSPSELRHFARELGEIAGEVRQRERRLESGVKSLGSTWADQKYRQFSKAQTAMSVQLQAFYSMASRYTAFLGRKADAADRYLGL